MLKLMSGDMPFAGTSTRTSELDTATRRYAPQTPALVIDTRQGLVSDA